MYLGKNKLYLEEKKRGGGGAKHDHGLAALSHEQLQNIIAQGVSPTHKHDICCTCNPHLFLKRNIRGHIVE